MERHLSAIMADGKHAANASPTATDFPTTEIARPSGAEQCSNGGASHLALHFILR
ncbi:hypothetical protein [Fodinicurvata sediminis]|uniref:hypothetical protein n=1 Tax=Fodinicurvata sediminis TaxID=1121832 RepID=UPI0004120E7F|nr:hypothetical protein [Fodinicurvata sediminis]